jgi:uncharacterized membrane protein
MQQGTRPFDFGLKVDSARFEQVAENGYQVNSSRYISEAWTLFRAHAAECVAYTLVLFLITAVLSLFDMFGSLLLATVTTPLYAGFAVVALKNRQGAGFVFSDLFGGFGYLLPLLLAGLMMWLLVTIGMFLLVLPGIYLAVAYMFTVPLIVDYRMEFWQAMETSRKIITRNWFSLFGFVLLLAVINLGGALVFGIGLLVTIPLTAFAGVMAYCDIVGEHERM